MFAMNYFKMSYKAAFLGIILSASLSTGQAQTIIAANQATMVQFMYWLINGPPSTGYPSGMDGPEDGLLGMIRQINGADALGGGLSESGYTTCASVPSTGEASITDSEGTFRMVFETPVKVIPSTHTGGDGSATYDKRVVVFFNNARFMETEFNCNATVGYLRFAENSAVSGGVLQSTARHIEAYYDTNFSSSTKLELAMYQETDANNDEYFLAKFQTSANSVFDFWITRVAQSSGTDSGFRIAARGNSSSKLASVYMFYEASAKSNTATNFSDNDDIDITGDVACIDFSSSSSPTDGGSSCSSLTIQSDPTGLIDTDGDMSIESVGNTAKLKAAFEAL